VRDGLILDAGCGKGRFAKVLAQCGRQVIGLDPVATFLHQAQRQVAGAGWIQGSLTSLPFDTGVFEGALCIDVLQHIPDTRRAVSELSRVTRPGGRLLVIDKNLVGIGYHRVFPNWLYKTVTEWLNRWMYPRDFPFRERWFVPWQLQRLIQDYYAGCEIHYLPGRVRGRSHKVLSPVLRHFSWLSPDVAWKATR
ncbi:MAG: class I SAM-dependent methyltransferase, partial [Chloroflexi bacterium]|nr:class I SAM-dependent methyltransferase [Chloroflexota bacterium]